MVDWTQLPPELVESISKKIRIYTDYLYFRVVCRTWRSILPNIPKHLPPQLPWLMIPASEPNQTHRAFFDLSADKFHFFNLPEAALGKRLCGSSHGWLIILNDFPAVLLFNPLSQQKIYLPSQLTFRSVVSFNYSNIDQEYVLHDLAGDNCTIGLRNTRDFFEKIVLSSSPLKESEFLAVAILGHGWDLGHLAYCRRDDSSWMIIENSCSVFEDVICLNGLFYALNWDGKIAVFNAGLDFPMLSFIETTEIIGGDMNYLVSSGNELLLVTRFLVYDFERDLDMQAISNIRTTVFYEIYRLDHDEQKWEEITSLGDRVLFIGEEFSLSLLASDFPGCKRNCIFYTKMIDDDYDVGIFKLSDKTFEPLPCYPPGFRSQLQWQSPIWVSPNPF